MINQTTNQTVSSFFPVTTQNLCNWLDKHLCPIDPENWWANLVYNYLTPNQQRNADRAGDKSLQSLDLAALLRIMDQNWFALSSRIGHLQPEHRNYLKELQVVRNRWSHLSTSGFSTEQELRDLDTLLLFNQAIEGTGQCIDELVQAKSRIIQQLARPMATSPEREDSAGETGVKSQATVQAKEKASETLFKVGKVVALKKEPQIKGVITAVNTSGLENCYEVYINDQLRPLFESQLILPPTAEAAGQKDTTSLAEARALLTAIQLARPEFSNLYSLNSARIDFIPYQFKPVLKLIKSDQPRILIADGVGIGKTIEAGLILKELQARSDIESVLIICPRPLVAEKKWEQEMKRFDEQFEALNGNSLRNVISSTDDEGEWPAKHNRIIIPYSLLNDSIWSGEGKPGERRYQIGLKDLDPFPAFDLVIVDEAHHIRNSNTIAHKAVKMFCEHAKAVVFLTATPVQMRDNDLFTLLNILRPDLVIDYPTFELMARPNKYIHHATRLAARGKDNWQKEVLENLNEAAGTEWGAQILKSSPDFNEITQKVAHIQTDSPERVEIAHRLEMFNSFANLINRTRRSDLGAFCLRKSFTIEIPFTEAQQELHDELVSFSETAFRLSNDTAPIGFMMTTVRRQLASCVFGILPFIEDWLLKKIVALEENDTAYEEAEIKGLGGIMMQQAERVTQLARQLNSDDPKFDRLLEILKQKQSLENNKVMVFSSFRHTLAYLSAKGNAAGLRCELVQGDTPDEERLHIRRRFSLPKGSADAVDVVFFSEVGSEGLDYQFCDTIVNYDLPWNPMRIEQRIGRIDRVGQKSEAVAIYNMITPGTVDADIYHRCLLRIGVFEQNIGECDAILGEVHQQLLAIGENLRLSEQERREMLDKLADNQIRNLLEEKNLENSQAELFGIDFSRAKTCDDIQAAESCWVSPAAIKNLLRLYLKEVTGREFNLQGARGSQKIKLKSPEKSLLLQELRKTQKGRNYQRRIWERWLKSSSEDCEITFEQEIAAENREAHFMNVSHPLVVQAAISLSARKLPPLAIKVCEPGGKPGTHYFAIYLWELKGIKKEIRLQVVASDDSVGENLLSYLETGIPLEAAAFEQNQTGQLDQKHHACWLNACKEFHEQMQKLAQTRLQSLTASYNAETRSVKAALMLSDEPNFQRMKKKQLENIETSFSERCREIKQQAENSDILTQRILTGIIEVEA